MMMEKTEERAAKAEALFREGYNCTQSVALTFADVYGMDRDQLARLATAFGGGIGRMRQTCGAACGMFILAGLERGYAVAPDAAAKADCYALVQELAAHFKERCGGSIICADLLGLPRDGKIQPKPEERTPEYYKKRPCPKIIAEAARIYAEFLAKEGKL